MHHALRIEEVLLNIFGHCHPVDPSWTAERSRCTADLAALTRTCRTFREPALDVLWSELIDLSPLAFCLPGRHQSSDKCYSFTGPPDDAGWETLRSYARRVWRILGFSSPSGYLDSSCISATFDSSLAEPLFPNLRFLRWQGGTFTLPVVHFAASQLISLDIRSRPREDDSMYTHLLNTLVPKCPNVRKVRIQVAKGAQFGETVSRHLRSWNKLQVVDCVDVAMPVDVIPHLSRISSLFWLSLTLVTQSLAPAPSSPLVFSRLVYLEIMSESLDAIADLMPHVRLPAVQVIILPFPRRPSRRSVRSCLTALAEETCASNALTDFRVVNVDFESFATVPGPSDLELEGSRLGLGLELELELELGLGLGLGMDDLRSCMALSHLRALHVNLAWSSVDLGDTDMLALVAAWPHLEHLVINDRWGWRTSRGITPRGLVEMLRRCPGLWEVCVALDTEGVDGARPLDLDLDLSARRHLRLNVADSHIRRTSVPALATALSVFGFSRNSDRFSAWNGADMGDIPGADEFRCLWQSVFF